MKIDSSPKSQLNLSDSEIQVLIGIILSEGEGGSETSSLPPSGTLGRGACAPPYVYVMYN